MPACDGEFKTFERRDFVLDTKQLQTTIFVGVLKPLALLRKAYSAQYTQSLPYTGDVWGVNTQNKGEPNCVKAQ